MWTKGQGVQAADGALSSYQAQIAELESERASIASDHRVVLTELKDALGVAAEIVLPDAEPATLERAARETGMTALPGRRRELEHKRAEWRARLAQIEADAYFTRRQALLHASRGEIALERQRLEAACTDAERRMARFDNETFRWVQARQAEQGLGRGALGSFWDAVTFSGYRVEKAQRRCAAELGFDTYDAALAAYRQCDVEIRSVQHRLAQNEALRRHVLALLEEHARLYGWTHEFEPRLLEMLRNEVAGGLARVDLCAVHGAIREEARAAIAKAHALSKKAEYLQNLAEFLQNQIADRKQRAGAIQKTRVAWSMRPWDRVQGDKSKWLVGLPAQKRASTHKQVRHVRRMHHNIIEYEDYDDYACYFAHDPGFLAYDAFAYGSEEPMPYEGFSRSVVPEIGSFRDAHGQERAEYGRFRSMDKQAAAEAREAEREARQDHGVEPSGLGAGERDEHAEPHGGDDGGGGPDDAGPDDLAEAEAAIETDDGGAGAGDTS